MSDPQFSDDYQSWERGMESRELKRLDLNVKGIHCFSIVHLSVTIAV